MRGAKGSRSRPKDWVDHSGKRFAFLLRIRMLRDARKLKREARDAWPSAANACYVGIATER